MDDDALEVGDTLAPRWRGQRGRLEVWYATISDPVAGIGFWVHHELVSPVEGEKTPYLHGWATAFKRGSNPVFERFGPESLPSSPFDTTAPPSVGSASISPPRIRGRSGALRWDLRWEPPEEPATLFTFPSWAWEREVLPGAQVVPLPSAIFSGSIDAFDEKVDLSVHARGNLAHIYGHGSAERWGWLHAELGGGDVLEIVSAVSRRPGLRLLKPMPFLQMRLGGRDWPRDPLMAATVLRTRLGLPQWTVSGTLGRARIRAEVTIPEESAARVVYTDPDGETATCTNSEVADAEIVLERRRARWETVGRWSLRASAHSEVGTRP